MTTEEEFNEVDPAVMLTQFLETYEGLIDSAFMVDLLSIEKRSEGGMAADALVFEVFWAAVATNEQNAWFVPWSTPWFMAMSLALWAGAVGYSLGTYDVDTITSSEERADVIRIFADKATAILAEYLDDREETE